MIFVVVFNWNKRKHLIASLQYQLSAIFCVLGDVMKFCWKCSAKYCFYGTELDKVARKNENEKKSNF